MGRDGTSSSFTVVVKHGLSIDGEEGPLPVREAFPWARLFDEKRDPPFCRTDEFEEGSLPGSGEVLGKVGGLRRSEREAFEKKQNKKKVTRALKIFKGDNKAAQTLPDPNLWVRALIIIYIYFKCVV